MKNIYKTMENDCVFRCLKIYLIILYTLFVIWCIIWFVFGIVGLGALGNEKADKLVQKENLESARNQMMALIVISAIALVLSVIALVGINKENQCIVMTLNVFGFIGLIVDLVISCWPNAIGSPIGTILIGVYAWKLDKKSKANYQLELQGDYSRPGFSKI